MHIHSKDQSQILQTVWLGLITLVKWRIQNKQTKNTVASLTPYNELVEKVIQLTMVVTINK